jgi:HAD superfamily hydrolase (TIGR01509 family)
MGDVARTDETLEFGGVVNPAALVFGTSITGFSRTSTTRATTSLVRTAPCPCRSRFSLSSLLPTDCDGTLVDTMGPFYVADLQTCEEFGMTMTLTQFYDLAGVPIREIFAILAKEQNVQPDLDAMAARCKALADALMKDGPNLIEPVIEIARRAHSKGVPIAVASSGVKPTVTGHLRGHGVLDMFQAVVTCEDVKQGKPAPDLYLLAAEKLGVDPTRCVAYEDAELGMESARRAGMTVVDVRDIPGVPDPRKDART